MNRQIEFRGKRIDNGEWVYGNLVLTNNSYFIIPFLTNGCLKKNELMLSWISPCFEVKQSTVGQFTGLVDKNDVKIYEGDKLNFIYSTEYGETKSYCNTVIADAQNFYLMQMLNQSNEITIIGNIQER